MLVQGVSCRRDGADDAVRPERRRLCRDHGPGGGAEQQRRPARHECAKCAATTAALATQSEDVADAAERMYAAAQALLDADAQALDTWQQSEAGSALQNASDQIGIGQVSHTVTTVGNLLKNWLGTALDTWQQTMTSDQASLTASLVLATSHLTNALASATATYQVAEAEVQCSSRTAWPTPGPLSRPPAVVLGHVANLRSHAAQTTAQTLQTAALSWMALQSSALATEQTLQANAVYTATLQLNAGQGPNYLTYIGTEISAWLTFRSIQINQEEDAARPAGGVAVPVRDQDQRPGHGGAKRHQHPEH